jgi:2-oxoglutarate dehydrogenase complex dehydrogenase (E1) component-like enzyme
VRLSGQDSQRGTFSHRHAVLTCQQVRCVLRVRDVRCVGDVVCVRTCLNPPPLSHLPLITQSGARVCPLDENLRHAGVGRFEVVNSPLSEFAVRCS